MSYLGTKWIQQDYPEDKKWLKYKSNNLPGIDLFTTKDKERGVIKLTNGLIKVIVAEIDGMLTVVGDTAQIYVGGNLIQAWMYKKDSIPNHQIAWLDNQEWPY